MQDIEKVRDRRRRREEEVEEMQRLRRNVFERRQYGDWQEKEDEFLQQTQSDQKY